MVDAAARLMGALAERSDHEARSVRIDEVYERSAGGDGIGLLFDSGIES
jgi:hypothetical protein